jgi:hypothetical protein
MASRGSTSKKPSGANSPSKLPDPIVFFLDRSLGKKRVAIALRNAGAIVHLHDDYFSPDARDEEWLSVVGEHGWVVLTKDSPNKISQYRTRRSPGGKGRGFYTHFWRSSGRRDGADFCKSTSRHREIHEETEPVNEMRHTRLRN